MHFYEFNIGDYAKKTAHLTNEEDVAYRRALDMYYDTEKPLPITHGLATLSRRLRVSENALKNIVDEFFPDGKNQHADEKIEEYHKYLDRQKSNGLKGGRPKVSQNNPLVSQNNPVPSQPLTTKPLTTNQDNSKTLAVGKPNCPHEEIIKLYHEILPMLTQVKIWNDKRKGYLQARWREDEKRQDLDYWKRFFEYVSRSDFLCGRVGDFQCSFEWLVNAGNFVKVIEGNYENRNKP